MPILEVKNITKKFTMGNKTFNAVKDVSFTIEPGQTYGLVGESGCGKSTIALSILALQGIDSGVILFEGQDIFKLKKRALRDLRPSFRMLFQNPESVLNPGMTLKLVLMEELEKTPGRSKKMKEVVINETIEHVGLQSIHLKRYSSGLSTGEKQRAAIAKAIITQPKFLVCDEPVASLDLSLKTVIIDLLMQLQKDLGMSYLYISHNLSLVKTIAHKIGIMYMGSLVEEAPADLFSVNKVLHPPTLNPEQFNYILNKYPDIDPTRFEEGCPFRNRCPVYLNDKIPACENQFPPQEIKGSQLVSCHATEEPTPLKSSGEMGLQM